MGFEDRDYYRDDYSDAKPGLPGFRFNRQTIVVSLIAINLAVFVLDMFTTRIDESGTQWLSHFLAIKATAGWQVWTFLTYGFAHASIATEVSLFHVFINMLTLYFLGPPVEERLGRWEFLKFYLLAVVISGLAWYLWTIAFGGGGFCVGASGAVSAVIVYFIMTNPNATLLMMGVIPTPAWVAGLIFLGVNLFQAFTSPDIAWQAHLGGAAFGAAYFQLGWNFNWLKQPRRGAKLKIHRGSEIDAKLQQEADRILAKIAAEGEASLTGRERRTLKKYSKQLQKQRG